MHVNSISYLVSQNQAKASSQVKPRQELAAKAIEDSYTPASKHSSEHPAELRAGAAYRRLYSGSEIFSGLRSKLGYQPAPGIRQADA